MSVKNDKEYKRKYLAAHKDHINELRRKRYARLTARPKLPKPKTYSEIAAYNRVNPIQEGWRR